MVEQEDSNKRVEFGLDCEIISKTKSLNMCTWCGFVINYDR